MTPDRENLWVGVLALVCTLSLWYMARGVAKLEKKEKEEKRKKEEEENDSK